MSIPGFQFGAQRGAAGFVPSEGPAVVAEVAGEWGEAVIGLGELQDAGGSGNWNSVHHHSRFLLAYFIGQLSLYIAHADVRFPARPTEAGVTGMGA